MDENLLNKIKELSEKSSKSTNELINSSISKNIRELSEVNNKLEPSNLREYIEAIKENEIKNSSYKILIDKVNAFDYTTNEEDYRELLKKLSKKNNNNED